jgi:hypothetical protein
MSGRSILSMTVATLVQTIKSLPARDQAKLFDKLGPALEDYLLAKIAVDRFKDASDKRIRWEELKP